jgi:hypothetical protein
MVVVVAGLPPRRWKRELCASCMESHQLDVVCAEVAGDVNAVVHRVVVVN